jgi:hypothetical protein
MKDLYGRVVPFKAVLLGKVPAPETTTHFLAVVKKWAAPTAEATGHVATAASAVVAMENKSGAR